MSQPLEKFIKEATDGPGYKRRANHPFDTKDAADALDIHENKLGAWADRTEDKLIRIAKRQPAQVAAFCLRILARSYAERDANK